MHEIITIVLPMIFFASLLYILIDYQRPRLIKYRPIGENQWFITTSEVSMYKYLDGQMADIIMPAAPLVERLYYKVRPKTGVKYDK